MWVHDDDDDDDDDDICFSQGTIGCTPNRVPMVFVVFSRDSLYRAFYRDFP